MQQRHHAFLCRSSCNVGARGTLLGRIPPCYDLLIQFNRHHLVGSTMTRTRVGVHEPENEKQ